MSAPPSQTRTGFTLYCPEMRRVRELPGGKPAKSFQTEMRGGHKRQYAAYQIQTYMGNFVDDVHKNFSKIFEKTIDILPNIRYNVTVARKHLNRTEGDTNESVSEASNQILIGGTVQCAEYVPLDIFAGDRGRE